VGLGSNVTQLAANPGVWQYSNTSNGLFYQQTAKKKTARSSLDVLTAELVGINFDFLFAFVSSTFLTHGMREHFAATFGTGRERWGAQSIV
jgi:hypothetical protein